MKTNKIGPYLAVSTGAGCIGTVNAATEVTLFGPDEPSLFAFRDAGFASQNFTFAPYSSGTGIRFDASPEEIIFTDGTTNLTSVTRTFSGVSYFYYESFELGASAGLDNYANISFDDNFDIAEGVGQFFFDGLGGGRLVALAVNNDGSALSITDGFAHIQAASVPEPSSLALLALGAAGLTARRQRRKAA